MIEKELSQYVRIDRSVPRQLSSLHNYFLAAVATFARTICVHGQNFYAAQVCLNYLRKRTIKRDNIKLLKEEESDFDSVILFE